MRNILVALCVLLSVSIHVMASSLPKKSDRAFVVDMSCKEEKVCIVTKTANDSWTTHAVDLQKRTGVQVALVVTHGTGNIPFEQYANDAANLLKVGTRGNGGIVFLFDNKERKARLEISRDLEGAIPDVTAKKIAELFSETLGQSTKNSSFDPLAKSLVEVLDSIDTYVTEYQTEKGGKVFVAEKDKSFTYFASICFIIVLMSSIGAVVWYSKRWYYTKGSLLGGVLCTATALVFPAVVFPALIVSLGFTFILAFMATFIFAWIWHRAGDSAGWDIIDYIPSDGVREVTGSMAEGVADFAGGGATEVVSTAVQGVANTATSAAESCDLSGCDPGGCDVSGCDIGGCDL